MPVTLIWPVTQPAPPAPVTTPVITEAPTVSDTGAINPDEYDVLRRFLHPGIKGDNTKALLFGLAAGDKIRNQLAQAAYDQFFLVTASGVYLERRTAGLGIQKPSGVGMSDVDFRRLAISIDNNKLTYEAILGALEVYYGEFLVKASIETVGGEPYALTDQDDLRVIFNDKEDITIVFDQKAFTNIGTATALEVSTFINNKLLELGSDARAIAQLDATTDTNKVILLSGKKGLSSSVQVFGGKAQTALNFPQAIFTDNGGSPYGNWDIKLSTETVGNLVFTDNSGVNYNFNKLLDGDLVYIYGPEFEVANTIGAFEISNVLYYYSGATLIQSFEIANSAGVQALALSQLAFNSLQFFRPVKETLYSQLRRVIVSKDATGLDIIIPATTQIVSRTPDSGAYIPANDTIDIVSINRIGNTSLATTSVNHNLSIGSLIELDDVVGTNSVPTPTTVTPSGAFSAGIATGTTGASPLTSVSATNTINKIRHKAYSILNNQVMVIGGEIQQDVGGTQIVANATPTVFSITAKTANNTQDPNYPAWLETYQWKALAHTLTTGNYDFGSSVLNSGSVLISGGFNGDNQMSAPYVPVNPYNSLYYNTATSQDTIITGALPITVAGHSQCSLGDGNAIISGGWVSQLTWNMPGAQAYKYTANTDTWTSIASMATGRMNHESVLLNNNKALVMGGRIPFTRPGAADDASDVSYWALDTFPSSVSPDLIGSNPITIDAVDTISGKGRGGNSFVPGGSTNSHTTAGASQTALNTALLGTYTAECWVLADATGTFMSNGTLGGGTPNNCLLSFGIAKYSSTNANDGKFFWRWENGTHAEVIQYSTILANTIFKTYESSHQGIWHHVALTKGVAISGTAGLYDVALYVDGVLIQTWLDQVNATGGSSGLFYLAVDPTNSTMTQLNTRIDEVRVSKVANIASVIKDHYNKQKGYTLFDSMDYWSNEYKIGKCLKSCEVYDPTGNTWTYTGSMAYAKTGFGVVSLTDGRIFTLGGLGYEANQSANAIPLNICEIYDTVSGRWIVGPAMPSAREFPICVLSNNKIIVSGGRNNLTIDILDLDTLQWKTSVTKTAVGAYRSAGALADSDTLVTCGGAVSTITANIYGTPHNADITSGMGNIIIPGEEFIRGGGLEGIFQVASVASGTTFTFASPRESFTDITFSPHLTGIKLAAKTSPPGLMGPYIFDIKKGLPVMSEDTTLSTQLEADQNYSIINVASTTGFVDDSYIVFNFGRSDQQGPVKLFNVISSTQLSIDPGFTFSSVLAIGSSITLLNGRTPFQLLTQTKGAFWATPSPAGRIAAVGTLNDIIGAGLDIRINVVYPNDRGIGGEGYPDTGDGKLSDMPRVFGE